MSMEEASMNNYGALPRHNEIWATGKVRDMKAILVSKSADYTADDPFGFGMFASNSSHATAALSWRHDIHS
jgi:hypothetical protein